MILQIVRQVSVLYRDLLSQWKVAITDSMYLKSCSAESKIILIILQLKLRGPISGAALLL